ncbi:MAG: nitroreductase family protein [Lachnospiraceae bacterium]|nr:nitroreductase family protein [Lachnospiraceae bacterium]
MNYYEQIFKRKSFHLFRETEIISNEELEDIKAFSEGVTPLVSGIKTAVRIVTEQETTCKRGAQYCILFYSERKGEYLQNIGYMGEQIDLYLASRNIGALWFGIGKPEQMTADGLDFVIMIAIAKMPEEKFRKDMFKAKRKSMEEIWSGETPAYANIVRFAPSACNTQPWKIEYGNHQLMVYRYKKPGKRGIMPGDKVVYYNRIDIGILLLFLEVCLRQEGIAFEKELFSELDDDLETVMVARYMLAND